MNNGPPPKNPSDVEQPTIITPIGGVSCERPGCPSRVVHAEYWNTIAGYRAWCAEHTPWSGHFEHCPSPCVDVLTKLGIPLSYEELMFRVKNPGNGVVGLAPVTSTRIAATMHPISTPANAAGEARLKHAHETYAKVMAEKDKGVPVAFKDLSPARIPGVHIDAPDADIHALGTRITRIQSEIADLGAEALRVRDQHAHIIKMFQDYPDLQKALHRIEDLEGVLERTRQHLDSVRAQRDAALVTIRKVLIHGGYAAEEIVGKDYAYEANDSYAFRVTRLPSLAHDAAKRDAPGHPNRAVPDQPESKEKA